MANFLAEVATYGSMVDPDRFGPLARIVATQEAAEMQRQRLTESQRQFDLARQQNIFENNRRFGIDQGNLQARNAEIVESRADSIRRHKAAMEGHAAQRYNVDTNAAVRREELAESIRTPEMRRFEYLKNRPNTSKVMLEVAEAQAYGIPAEEFVYRDDLTPQERERVIRQLASTDQVLEEGGTLYQQRGSLNPTLKMLEEQVKQEQATAIPPSAAGQPQESSYEPNYQSQIDMRGLDEVWQQDPQSILQSRALEGIYPYSPTADDDNPVLEIQKATGPGGEENPYSPVGAPMSVVINDTPIITPPMDPLSERVDQDPEMDEFLDQTPDTSFQINFSGALRSATSQDTFNVARARPRPKLQEKVPGSGLYEDERRADTDDKRMEAYNAKMDAVQNGTKALASFYTLVDNYGIGGITDANAAGGALRAAWSSQLTTWRDQVKAGTLDEGSINMFETVLGKGWIDLDFKSIADHLLKWGGSGQEGIEAQLKAQSLNALTNLNQDFRNAGNLVLGDERKAHNDIYRVSLWGKALEGEGNVRKLLDTFAEETALAHMAHEVTKGEKTSTIPEPQEEPPPSVNDPTQPPPAAPRGMQGDTGGPGGFRSSSVTAEDQDYLTRVTQDFVEGAGAPLLRELNLADRDNDIITRELSESLDRVLDAAPEVIWDRNTRRLHQLLEVALVEELDDIGGVS